MMKYTKPIAFTVAACATLALSALLGGPEAEAVSQPPQPEQAASTAMATPIATPEGASVKAPIESLMARKARLAYTDQQDWERWKQLFLHKSGRVIDTANGGISHSEGQGYGMLLATHFKDEAAFNAMWGFAQSHLQFREDGLFAWKFEPDSDTPVTDENAASDGDLLIAWALKRGAERFDEPKHLAEAQRIARAIRKHLVTGIDGMTVLLPGPHGFEHEDGGRITVNPSYIIFPALTEIARIDPDPAWNGIARSGLSLIRNGTLGETGLPADWLSITRDGAVSPDPGWTPEYGYNAMRVPLYMVWGGLVSRDDLQPYQALWNNKTEAGVSHVLYRPAGSDPLALPDERGYQAIPALINCALTGSPSGHPHRLDDRALPADAPEGSLTYYATTLELLTRMAAAESQPNCR